MTALVAPAQVRDYLNITATTGQYSDSLIGSNINAATSFLQRKTGRQFEWQGSNVRKVFTTEGRAAVTIPDLTVANSVSLQGTALTADSTYWLIPDRRNSGVYTGIQFRAFGAYDYRSNPEWFDRNLDNWRWAAGSRLPNDLAVEGEWGYHTPPPDVLSAITILAAYYTKFPDAIISGGIQTTEGTVVIGFPDPVQAFINDWQLSDPLVAA
jgi:hypothetical protein